MKKIIAVLLCFTILFTSNSPLLLIVGSTEGAEPVVETGEPMITESSIFPESTLEWQSYEDYFYAQADAAMKNPALYVGCEVSFFPSWDSIFCRSGFEAGDTEKYVGLDYESAVIAEGSNKINVNGLRLVITGYHVDDSKNLWYKVAAPAGEALPEILESHPYIWHIDSYAYENNELEYTPPTFYMLPQKAIFLPDAETVTFKKKAEAATHEVAVSVEALPAIFDVVPVFEYDSNGRLVWSHYDLGDIASEYTEYRYVTAESVILIPAETSAAFEKLMNAEDTYAYYEILRSIPEEVQEKLSDAHKAELDQCIEALIQLDQVTYETEVTFDGVEVPVTVMGNIPDDVTLSAEAVTFDDIHSAGFEVTAEEHIIGLDIKLLNPDSTQWQPKEGRQVFVSIGLNALGYGDGSLVKLKHKHGEVIESFDVAVVEGDAVTIAVSGFSIFEVLTFGSTTSIGTTIGNNSTIELEVGVHKIFYFNHRDGANPRNTIGTWEVIDKSGAVNYTVYRQTTLGHNGIYVPWLEINTLKETTSPEVEDVKLIFRHTNGNTNTTENYTLRIITPKAGATGRKLYLKDEVNTTGSIVATLVDENGNEIEGGLDGASFSWERSDDHFIVPTAYGEGYRSVNIARDHSGLVEARRDPDTGEFEPVTYKVTVYLSDSTKEEAEYTVYYQSEIVNANFELPETDIGDTYTYFPNGWKDLYWATTAPGSSRGMSYVSMDIEYGTPSGSATGWGIDQAADGKQFAEINCETFGALYQDIITAPGEVIEWEFAHAPRQDQDWSGEISNRMFIVIGATETAQELTQDDLLKLGQSALTAGKGNTAFMNGQASVTVSYPDDGNASKYYVWYHDAGHYAYRGTYNGEWTNLEGSYMVPEGQYRTRLFFVSWPYDDKGTKVKSDNAGNLIDKTKAGQYKRYLIEYYEQSYVNGKLTLTHLDMDEVGEALVYSSVKLENFYDKLVVEQHDYLHHVDINGNPYPYDIRYVKSDPNNAYLYIERYAGTPTYGIEGETRDYSEYDIVMQLYFRDTVVAVKKQLELPAGLSEEQKNDLMKYFNTLTPAGYQSQFKLFSQDGSYSYSETGNTYITQRDPSGNYQAFVALGENPEIGHTYCVEETGMTEIPGLELESVEFRVQLYKAGQKFDDIKLSSYIVTKLSADDKLLSEPFQLKGDVKIADVVVVNTYKEKDTVIVYHGVGNGKIKIDKEGAVFEDAPSESIAFYSERADGCTTHAGAGATFVGWYKDPECKELVTAADGVWDKKTGSFIPNANVTSDTEIHFYAKFETGSITIERAEAEPYQTFVYHIQSTDNTVDMYVTLACDATGNGKVEILEVPLDKTYKVTEHEDWSWRHKGETKSDTNGNIGGETILHLKYKFASKTKNEWWLNGYSGVYENVFEKGT